MKTRVVHFYSEGSRLEGDYFLPADLKAGDKLIAVNGHRTTEASIKDFKQIVDEVGRTHRHLWMLVQRRGAFKKIDVMMEPYSKGQIERIVTQHLSEAHSIASAPPDSRP